MLKISMFLIVTATILALFAFTGPASCAWCEAARWAYFPMIGAGVFFFWRGFK